MAVGDWVRTPDGAAVVRFVASDWVSVQLWFHMDWVGRWTRYDRAALQPSADLGEKK